MRVFHRRPIVVSVMATMLVAAWLAPGAALQTTRALPAQLSDEAFWALISEMSEPAGVFPPSENFVSNERSFQQVVGPLARDQHPASAYVGVGPEQNFTYLIALEPQIAFVIDIRRENLAQHLMYKALFELAADRADFLSRLFSRPRPANLDENTSAADLVDAFDLVPTDASRRSETVEAVTHHLTKTHGFPLTVEDENTLARLLTAFSFGGPRLTYNGLTRRPGNLFPTFGDLMVETDASGVPRGFLATEANFRTIQAFEKKNLLIPIVGDFAGPKALRAIGRYLRDRDATVTAFYTSNVEQYLFLNNVWPAFYANISTLPAGPNSVVIRSVIRTADGTLTASPAMLPTSHLETMLFPIGDLVSRFGKGSISSYYDVVGAAQ